MSWSCKRANGLTSIVGVGLTMALLSGCGGSGPTKAGSGSTTAAQGSASVSAAKQSAAGAASATGATTARTGQSSASNPGASTPAATPPAWALGGRPLRRFAGYGNQRLGTISLTAPAALVWTAPSGFIQLFTSTGFMLVNSHEAAGAVRLSQGTYRAVRVASGGSWSIELRS